MVFINRLVILFYCKYIKTSVPIEAWKFNFRPFRKFWQTERLTVTNWLAFNITLQMYVCIIKCLLKLIIYSKQIVYSGADTELSPEGAKIWRAGKFCPPGVFFVSPGGGATNTPKGKFFCCTLLWPLCPLWIQIKRLISSYIFSYFIWCSNYVETHQWSSKQNYFDILFYYKMIN